MPGIEPSHTLLQQLPEGVDVVSDMDTLRVNFSTQLSEPLSWLILLSLVGMFVSLSAAGILFGVILNFSVGFLGFLLFVVFILIGLLLPTTLLSALRERRSDTNHSFTLITLSPHSLSIGTDRPIPLSEITAITPGPRPAMRLTDGTRQYLPAPTAAVGEWQRQLVRAALSQAQPGTEADVPQALRSMQRTHTGGAT